MTDDVTPESLPTPEPPDEGAWARGAQMFPSRRGTRQISLAALVERVADQFEAEHEGDSPALREAVTRGDRLKLVRESVLYVVGVESVVLTNEELASVIQAAFGEVFGYGGLERYFSDPSVTTVALEGTDKLAVRYGHADLMPQPPVFDDIIHLERIFRRILRDARAEIRPELPYYEIGMTYEGRRVCANFVTPPVSAFLSVDFRLHPLTPPTLDDFTDSPEALALLRDIAAGEAGVLVVGDAESGKTSLLGAMARAADLTGAIAVERAGELALPDGVERLLPRWPLGDEAGIGFGQRIGEAVARQPKLLILDEVRADDPAAIAPLVGEAPPDRQMWSFRGTTEAKRLAPALGMLARRADPDQSGGDERALRLYERLPYVVCVRRREGRLRVVRVARWDYPNLVTVWAL
jgi:Flp pilus assembly CpaF family ATPase